jgi:hypothetical protein
MNSLFVWMEARNLLLMEDFHPRYQKQTFTSLA